jgi:hypothetical protein
MTLAKRSLIGERLKIIARRTATYAKKIKPSIHVEGQGNALLIAAISEV